MDYLSNNVAVNLKRIRKSKSMSLDQVSEQTGVSKSMLAQIERGTANPSLGVLGKITSGLRIEFQELIQLPRVDCCLVTPAELVPTKEVAGQYRVWTVCLMRIPVWWRCTGSRWNRVVFISVAAMGRRQENIWLLWRVCLLWNVMVRSMKSTEIRCLSLKRIRSMSIGTQGRRKLAVPVFFWIIIDAVVSGILLLKRSAAGENPVCRILPCMIGGLP